MAQLITTISQLQEYVKVNFTNRNSTLPNFTRAQEEFLLPALGQTLYDQVTADTPAGSLDSLVDHCRYVVGPLAYWLDLPTIQTQITDNGLKTAENENYTAAHRWEYEKIEAKLQDDGLWGMERLLKHLHANAETYSWTAPDEFKLVFKTADDFLKYYKGIKQPYRTFNMLRTAMGQVQDQYIITSIGEEFFEELRDYDGADAGTLAAIKLLKKAVANLTIMRAIETMSTQLTKDGFTVKLSHPDSPNTGEAAAPGDMLSLTHGSAKNIGESYLNQLREFLNENASASVFATYFASDYYEDPDEEEDDPNEDRTGVYAF